MADGFRRGRRPVRGGPGPSRRVAGPVPDRGGSRDGARRGLRRAAAIGGASGAGGRLVRPDARAVGGPGMAGHQEREARAWFAGSEPAAGALDLVLTGRRHLFAPQVLLHLARLALVHGSGADPSDDEPPEVLAETAMRAVMLVLAHYAGSERRDRDDALRRPDGMLGLDGSVVTGLGAEVAANLLANHRPFPASALDRSERRWVEIPREDAGCPGVVDLAGEFLAATGVPLQDLRMVGVALWAMVMGGSGPRARPGYLDDLGLGPDRTCRVLWLIGGTAAEFAAQERAVAGPGLGSVYDTTVFGRRPVVRLANGGLLVVSPHLLVARTLGWLPLVGPDERLEEVGTGWAEAGEAGRRVPASDHGTSRDRDGRVPCRGRCAARRPLRRGPDPGRVRDRPAERRLRRRLARGLGRGGGVVPVGDPRDRRCRVGRGPRRGHHSGRRREGRPARRDDPGLAGRTRAG